MNCKTAAGVFCGLLLCAASSVWAQSGGEEVEWKESETPAPPAFDLGKLITLDVSPNASLVYGIDPASISISRSDGVVRYVVVARSASGATNVMYEGVHCAGGRFKTYARASAEGRWTMVENPQWRSLFDNMPSKHALRFAKAGGCDNAAQPTSVQTVISGLKNSAR